MNVWIGYLQHSASPVGPFRTEAVTVGTDANGKYHAWFAGKWRRVISRHGRTFIGYHGARITIQIMEGDHL